MPSARVREQRRPEHAQRHRVSVYIDDELYARLSGHAVMRRLTTSGAARRLIEERLNQLDGKAESAA